MAEILVREMLEAGAHFGHRVSRWNPKMARHIYGKRNGVHIIDLRETLKGLLRGQRLLTKLTSMGGEVLFVGTKRSAREPLARHAARAQCPFVNDRWLGGTLTNHQTILSRLYRLEELEQMEATGSINTFSKKMVATLQREKKKILRNLEGIRTMKRLPAAMVVVDPRSEENAVKEAQRMRIPTVGLVDTDSDPDMVDICVPANDDAVKTSEIFARVMADAVLHGRAEHMGVTLPTEEEQASEAGKKATAVG